MVDASNDNFHRLDIDGLRAIAVVPVIFFHANIACRGGFVGVDIFFVISGYLITGIIERDILRQRFSIIKFYNRRIRRIFPAMFSMVLLSSFVALVTLPPHEVKNFGRSVVATSAFFANILDYRHLGYFDTSSAYDPLLHMWTLSVEEQFYILWPLMLWAFCVFSIDNWKIPVVVCIIFVSLLLSAYWVSNNPNAAFYLLPSRAWELALGAAVALLQNSNVLSPPRIVADIASLAGLVMIATAIMSYDSVTPFPGYAALLPCIGAALIVAAGNRSHSAGGKILSFYPLVFTGRISYSLYLWHWPSLVFTRLILNRELAYWERSSAVVLTFTVAWLSWRFIESPFRDARYLRSDSVVWLLGGISAAFFFVSVGAILYVSDGIPARSPNVALWVTAASKEANAFERSSCLAWGGELPQTQGCLLGAPSSTSTYSGVLWGDSHASQFAPAINEIGEHLGITVREITKAGCAPVPGVSFLPIAEMRRECPAFNDAALKAVLADKQVNILIIAARWDVLIEGRILLTLDGALPSINDSRQLLSVSLRRTLDALANSGRQVFIIGQVPLPGLNPIDCIARARFNNREESQCVSLPVGKREETEALVTQTLRTIISDNPNIHLILPYSQLCEEQRCRLIDGDRLLYMDDVHLSAAGARRASIDLESSIAATLDRQR